MPVTLQDLQQLATRGDLIQLRQEIAGMLSDFATQISQGEELTSFPGQKPFYSPKEFGALIGVSRQTVLRWSQDGTINALQKGGKGCLWLIPHSELERLQEEADDLTPNV